VGYLKYSIPQGAYMSIICGNNCYFIPFKTAIDSQDIDTGFYYKNDDGLYIGPFNSIQETEESKRLGFVAVETFDL
jgi:hypothetical protein